MLIQCSLSIHGARQMQALVVEASNWLRVHRALDGKLDYYHDVWDYLRWFGCCPVHGCQWQWMLLATTRMTSHLDTMSCKTDYLLLCSSVPHLLMLDLLWYTTCACCNHWYGCNGGNIVIICDLIPYVCLCACVRGCVSTKSQRLIVKVLLNTSMYVFNLHSYNFLTGMFNCLTVRDPKLLPRKQLM